MASHASINNHVARSVAGAPCMHACMHVRTYLYPVAGTPACTLLACSDDGDEGNLGTTRPPMGGWGETRRWRQLLTCAGTLLGRCSLQPTIGRVKLDS